MQARKANKYEESANQIMLINWFDLQYAYISRLLVHVPNGQNTDARIGARFKQLGLRKGFPDLMLLYPTSKACGLFIEMKAEKGKLSAEQKEYLWCLEQQGYKAEVAYSFDEAKEIIESYIKDE